MNPSPLERIAVLLVVVVGCTGCGSSPRTQEAASSTGSSASAPSIPGREQYERAKQAILAGDTRGAKAPLEEATRLGPQTCEYWYQLGAVESNLAIDVVNESESEAVRLFTDGVDHKREALRLIGLGQCPIWTDAERDQARADAQAGLAGSEAVLRDPVSLVIALKMYAAQRGR